MSISRLHDFTDQTGDPISSLQVDEELDQLVAAVAALQDAVDTHVPTAAEVGLKIVRGLVNADGTIAEGTGFTVVKAGTSDYTVTFTSPFSDVPAVVVQARTQDTSIAALGTPVAASFPVTTAVGGGSAAAKPFSFIAVGPA